MKKRHLIALFMILLLLIPSLSGCGKDLTTKISLESGEYYGEQEITLSNAGTGTIYYTLDGSDPRDGGNEYNPEMPLKINYDSTLKAYTKEGSSKGKVAAIPKSSLTRTAHLNGRTAQMPAVRPIPLQCPATRTR